MGVFKNIGHLIASVGIGIWDSLTNQPTNGSIAEQVGAGVGQLVGAGVPGAKPLINAAVTGFGDIVQAAKATGQELKAGDSLTIVVSDALAAAANPIWPDVEKVVKAFEGAIGSPAPAAPTGA
jgi:hypothetical protein